MQIRVILVGTEGEANLGMVARLIDNFCADELYLVKPRVEVGEEALRYAVKAVDTLENAVVVESLEEALE
ncbi:MAG: rRNA methyltransferase, partial [Desulfurococcales archaeon]|nr:rRNA methyltransferase [Desulfurococcales archaeon]